MTDKKLKPYTVYIRRRGGCTRGRVEVMANSPTHAERVGIRQCIETSFPQTKPAQWIVTLVEERRVEVVAVVIEETAQIAAGVACGA